VAVQLLIYEVDLAWKPTSQTGGLPWMPALADSATFWTAGYARVADGRIQPAQTPKVQKAELAWLAYL